VDEKQQVIARIADSLNQIQTMKAMFIQRAPDGTVSEGMVYLERPGRIRFEYIDNDDFLVVSDGTMLNLIDYEMKRIQRWPVNDTPLKIILDKESRFDDKVEVAELVRFAGLVKVPVIDKDRRDQGYITLIFEESTMELRAWEVVDAQGYLTRVGLVNPEYNVAIDKKHFQYKDPRPATELRGPRR